MKGVRREAVPHAEEPRSAGGAAEAGGALFQNRVAAWYAARILTSRPPAVDLAHLGASLRCQVDDPVDDVFVALQGGGSLFIQAKRSISVSEKSGSDFASVISQFVRQYLKSRAAAASTGAAHRVLDPSRDRLLLVVSRRAPATVTVFLPSVLERVRSTVPGTRIETSLISKADREAWRTIRRPIAASRPWTEAAWQLGHANGGGNASAKPSVPRGESFCKTHAAGVPTFCKPTTRQGCSRGAARRRRRARGVPVHRLRGREPSGAGGVRRRVVRAGVERHLAYI